MNTDLDLSPLDRPGATLVCDTAIGDGVEEACDRALVPDPGASVLWVSYTGSPTDRFARIPAVSGDRKAVIDVSGGTRSAAADGSGGTEAGSVSVVEPSDLTGIGIAVAKALADTDGVHVCFDSLTAMLQYVGTKRAYTFLNSLLGHLWNAGAQAHFHFNPEAHDDRTVAAVTSLFDARVDVADGTVRVRASSAGRGDA